MEMNELMYTPHWPNPEQRQQHKLEQESKCKKVLSALTVSCSNHCQQAARTAIRPQEPDGEGTYGTEVLPRTFSGYPFNVYFKNIQIGCTLLSIIAIAFLKYTRLYLLVVIKIFYNIFWNKGSGFFLETRDIGFFIKPKNIKNQRPFTTREYCLENYFYNNILAVKKSYFSIDRLINMIY